jgi:hypothetical protein
MPYVKLDCGILDSSIWPDKPARDLFITALLMARPYRLAQPRKELETDSLKETGFEVPAGSYGLIEAAGPAIVSRAKMDEKEGLEALKRLAAPDIYSRTPKFDGKRMIRVQGGFIVLNYFDYRDKDHTNAERQRTYRSKKSVTPLRNDVTRYVTHADADADADKTPPPPLADINCVSPEKNFAARLAGGRSRASNSVATEIRNREILKRVEARLSFIAPLLSPDSNLSPDRLDALKSERAKLLDHKKSLLASLDYPC